MRIRMTATSEALHADAAPEMLIVDDGADHPTLFGLSWDPTQKTEHYYPLTITRGGAIDFGHGYDRSKADRAIKERYANMDLFSDTTEDRLVTFSTKTYEQEYRITDIED